ncbi:uncharacterized protein SCHCODRAFT_02341986 [Schizophyllum commune H4-8]|uniref:uncharacterized protein n=1 Tax=Schizophyllum commune (strain H4-8 / FGSC 9210) TaxID=578458 RepID=UPI00215DFDE7|nr:uncharacterized protein SCHCODRAFT_02341986 [Schizophyllum commune H4-8]KAI5890323.1 hypothetical protein SCHCODRAFT_02341986 [Schizophyllum commune H4-8]
MASNAAPARTRSRLALPDEQPSLDRSPLRAAKSANRMKTFSPVDGADPTARAPSEDARSQSTTKSGKRSASPPPADEYTAGTPASEDSRELKRARREEDPTRRSDEENQVLLVEGSSNSAAHTNAGSSRPTPEHDALQRALASQLMKPSSTIATTRPPSTPSHDRSRSVPVFPAPASQSIPHIDFTQPAFSPIRQRARSRSPAKEPTLRLYPASPEKAPTFELARSTVNGTATLQVDMPATSISGPSSSAEPPPLSSTPTLELDTPTARPGPFAFHEQEPSTSQVVESTTSQAPEPPASQASEVPTSQASEAPAPQLPPPTQAPAPRRSPPPPLHIEPHQPPADEEPGSPLTSIPGSPVTPGSPLTPVSPSPPPAVKRLPAEDPHRIGEDMQMDVDIQMDSQSSLTSRPSTSRLPRLGPSGRPAAPRTRQASGSKPAPAKAGTSKAEAASKPTAASKSKATGPAIKPAAAMSKPAAATSRSTGEAAAGPSKATAGTSRFTAGSRSKATGATAASKPNTAAASKLNAADASKSTAPAASKPNAFTVLMSGAKGKAKDVGAGKAGASGKPGTSSKPTAAKSSKTAKPTAASKPSTSSKPDASRKPSGSSKPESSTSTKPRSMSRATSIAPSESGKGKGRQKDRERERESSVVSTKSSVGGTGTGTNGVKVKAKMRGRQQPKPIPTFVYPDEEDDVPPNDEEVPLNDVAVPLNDAAISLYDVGTSREGLSMAATSASMPNLTNFVPPPEFRFPSSPAPSERHSESGVEEPGGLIKEKSTDGDVEMHDATAQEPRDDVPLTHQDVARPELRDGGPPADEQLMAVDLPTSTGADMNGSPTMHAPTAPTAEPTTHIAISSSPTADASRPREPTADAPTSEQPATEDQDGAASTAITDATNQVPNDGVITEPVPVDGESSAAKDKISQAEDEGRGRARQKAQPTRSRAPSKATTPRVTRSVSVRRQDGTSAGVTPATGPRGRNNAPQVQDSAQRGRPTTQASETRQGRTTSRARPVGGQAPTRISPRTARSKSRPWEAPKTPKAAEKAAGPNKGHPTDSKKDDDRLVEYPTSDLSDLPDDAMDTEEDNVVHISKAQRPVIVQKRPAPGKAAQTFSTHSASSKEASTSSTKAATTKIPGPSSPTKMMPKTPTKSISVMIKKTPSPNKRARSSSLARPSSSFSLKGQRESLSILERALERVDKPAPTRPSTSMGFASDDTPSNSTTASMMQAPMTDLGPRGLKRSASADSEASMSKRPSFERADLNGGAGPSSRPLGQKPIGAFFRRPAGAPGPFGHRAPKASRQPMLQTVIGSPVKGGGAPVATDDDEEMPQIQPFMPMLPPAEPEAGPSQPMVDSPDEMPEDDDLQFVVSPELLREDAELAELIERNRAKDEAARHKPRPDAAAIRLEGRRASSAFSALSQSLNEMPAKRKGDMGPPKTPPRPGTRQGLRSASNPFPGNGDGAGGSDSAGGEGSKGKEREKEAPEPKLDVLKGCVIFIDVRTDDGNEYQDVFKLNLKRLGARVISRLAPSCTHIIYKNGLPNTAVRFRLMDPRPKVVGIRWAVECVEQRQHVDEEGHLIDLEHVDVAGHLGKQSRPARRRSLIPQRSRKEKEKGSEDLDLDLDVDMEGDADTSIQSLSSTNSEEEGLTPLERARLRRKMRVSEKA